MKTLFRLVVTMMLLLGWGLAASALHLVWTGRSALLLSKREPGARDTYVNVSTWTADDVSNHPVISRRLIETDNAKVLAHVFESRSEDHLIDQIDRAIAAGPQAPRKSSEIVKKARALVVGAKRPPRR